MLDVSQEDIVWRTTRMIPAVKWGQGWLCLKQKKRKFICETLICKYTEYSWTINLFSEFFFPDRAYLIDWTLTKPNCLYGNKDILCLKSLCIFFSSAWPKLQSWHDNETNTLSWSVYLTLEAKGGKPLVTNGYQICQLPSDRKSVV